MKFIRSHPVAAFFILSCIITWTFQLSGIVLAQRLEMTLGNESNFRYFLDILKLQLPAKQLLAYGIFTLGAGPLFSSIVLTWVLVGKKGLLSLWYQSTKWKLGIRWYLITLAVPLFLSVLSISLAFLASGG